MREMISHFPRQYQKFSSETTHSCVDLVRSQPYMDILFILTHSGFTFLVSSQRTHACVNGPYIVSCLMPTRLFGISLGFKYSREFPQVHMYGPGIYRAK
jgi:hypothetical protein